MITRNPNKVNIPRVATIERNMSRYKPEGWLIILVAVFLMTCLIVGIIHTMYSFKPNAEAIMARQAAMQSQLDRMEREQAEMRQQLESWQGVGK